MKNFIEQFKNYQNGKEDFRQKLVWNPKGQRWLTTVLFTKEYITKRGLEVVCE